MNLSLVPTCPKNRKKFSRIFTIFRRLGFFETSVNTPSQTAGDFYDVIGKIGSFSNLKVLSQTVPDVGDFYDECEREICLSGTVADDREFLR